MSAITRTDVANKALAHVGEDPIMDIDDPILESARVIRSVWNMSRRQLLEEARWKSHKTRETNLAQLATAPTHGWDYQYELPVDFIKIVEFNRLDVWEVDQQDFFDIENGSKLVTNEETVSIVYIRDDEDISIMSPYMQEALAVLVGSNIASPIRQDEQKQITLLDLYDKTILPRAMRHSAINAKQPRWKPDQDSRLVQARSLYTFD